MGYVATLRLYCSCHYHHAYALPVHVGDAQSVSKYTYCIQYTIHKHKHSLTTLLLLQKEVDTREEARFSAHHALCQKLSSYRGGGLRWQENISIDLKEHL